LPLSERIEALAVQLEQLVPLGVAPLHCFAEDFGYAAHQALGALVVAGDAVAGENLARHPLDAFGGVLDLGYVLPQDPASYVLLGGGAGCCQANPWPRSSMSIRGWSTWLMRMRLAMVSRRRS
jgi:hypothetical protein